MAMAIRMPMSIHMHVLIRMPMAIYTHVAIHMHVVIHMHIVIRMPMGRSHTRTHAPSMTPPSHHSHLHRHSILTCTLTPP